MYRPKMTLLTACAPTIWLIGVTSGGNPRSARVRGISSSTSLILSRASASRSWETMLDANSAGNLVAEYVGVYDGGACRLQVVGVFRQNLLKLVAQVEQRVQVNAGVALRCRPG